MSRRGWVSAILAAWVLSLGWLVKREVFRPTGARLAEAALAVAPGALFYRLDVGSQQVGYSSTTIDTLATSLRVTTIYVLDVPALGKLHRTTARSTAMLSRALRLQSVDATFDGDIGQFAAHGRVIGDTVLTVAIVSSGGRDSQLTRIPLTGPVTLPALLPLRLAFGGELRSGRSYTARLFDPLLVTGRDVTARISAESTLVVSDSADLDSTTMTWVPEHFDTVRAFRIDQASNGVRMRSWIDAQGRVVLASTEGGFAMERAAFESVFENFKHRDTARVARASATPAAGEIVPVTALVAGIKDAPAPRARMLVRRNGRDTVTIVQATVSDAAYRLPSSDTAFARWLAPAPLIQSHDPRIAAQARQIIDRERTPLRVAELLTHWVHRSVQRAIRPPAEGVPSAVRVLETRRGDCNDAATLLVALARATGLPARTVAGLIYLNGRFYYHAWAEVYLKDWVAVDPTYDQFPADAAHWAIATGGLARQVELVPLIGRLKLEVL